VGGQAPKGKDTISHQALSANYTLVCDNVPRRCDRLPDAAFWRTGSFGADCWDTGLPRRSAPGRGLCDAAPL